MQEAPTHRNRREKKEEEGEGGGTKGQIRVLEEAVGRVWQPPKLRAAKRRAEYIQVLEQYNEYCTLQRRRRRRTAAARLSLIDKGTCTSIDVCTCMYMYIHVQYWCTALHRVHGESTCTEHTYRASGSAQTLIAHVLRTARI